MALVFTFRLFKFGSQMHSIFSRDYLSHMAELNVCLHCVEKGRDRQRERNSREKDKTEKLTEKGEGQRARQTKRDRQLESRFFLAGDDTPSYPMLSLNVKVWYLSKALQ